MQMISATIACLNVHDQLNFKSSSAHVSTAGLQPLHGLALRGEAGRFTAVVLIELS